MIFEWKELTVYGVWNPGPGMGQAQKVVKLYKNLIQFMGSQPCPRFDTILWDPNPSLDLTLFYGIPTLP